MSMEQTTSAGGALEGRAASASAITDAMHSLGDFAVVHGE